MQVLWPGSDCWVNGAEALRLAPGELQSATGTGCPFLAVTKRN